MAKEIREGKDNDRIIAEYLKDEIMGAMKKKKKKQKDMWNNLGLEDVSGW